jgi:hypothetical protein
MAKKLAPERRSQIAAKADALEEAPDEGFRGCPYMDEKAVPKSTN